MSNVTNSKWLAKVCGVAVGLVVAAQAQAAAFSVNQSITFVDPPTAIIATNNPFIFGFTSLPSNALTDATVRISGIADVDNNFEGFEYFVEGISRGSFIGLGNFAFDLQFTIDLADLTPMLSDGNLEVRVVFDSDVNIPVAGDFIKTNIQYRADVPVNGVPEPGTLALLGLALAGLRFSRRQGKSVSAT